jgi:hypothetical protein
MDIPTASDLLKNLGAKLDFCSTAGFPEALCATLPKRYTQAEIPSFLFLIQGSEWHWSW